MSSRSRPNPAGSVRGALRLVEGPVNLLGYDTSAKPCAPGGKAKTTELLLSQTDELTDAQSKLYASALKGSPRRVLLVLQGMDTAGKDGVVSHVVGLVGPAGVKITSFRKPTPEEAAHHFLWRIRRALPAAGIIGVFNRSHYEDVLSDKVHERLSSDLWDERITDIVRFEHELDKAGTVLIKCFLHISYAEQRNRLLDRLDDPTKVWKFNPADIDERAYWADYQAVYGSVLEQTSTDTAPWYVVPSDAKWYRNWAIATILSETLAELDLTYPGPDFDVEAARGRLRPPH